LDEALQACRDYLLYVPLSAAQALEAAAEETLAANHDPEGAFRSAALQKMKDLAAGIERELGEHEAYYSQMSYQTTFLPVVRVERISQRLAEGAELAQEAGLR
jgi:hypothetical protein